MPRRDNTIIDTVIHEPARLRIMSLLAAAEEADFNYLLTATKMTKGNLSFHLSKLEEANYLKVRKYFRGKVPHTDYSITKEGRKAYKKYLKDLDVLWLDQELLVSPVV